MTTLKRLSDDDVRGVFQSLREGKPPPSHLKFQIVPVGPRGLKLSPPSHEFADGLYVLLRPQKKKKNLDVLPRVPEHLQHLVMQILPPETCPWSLSGPQFPTPATIQQRYCYPKGRLEYSSRKGGALWTMYDPDGKEDTEFRLLHVYLSPKRAANKGVDLSKEEKAIIRKSASSSNKKMRYTRGKAVSSADSNFLQYKNAGHSNKLSSSTSSHTNAPPISYHGTSMVASPPSLSPLSFDRLQAPLTSPANTPGSHYHHHHHHVPGGDLHGAPYYYPHHEEQQHYTSSSTSGPTFVTPVHTNQHHSARSNNAPLSSSNKHIPFWHNHQNNNHNHNIHQSPLQRTAYLDDPRADPFWGEGDDSCSMDASSFHEIDMMMWPDPFASTGTTGTNSNGSSFSSTVAAATASASTNTTSSHHNQNNHHHRHHRRGSSSTMMIMGVTADSPPSAYQAQQQLLQHPHRGAGAVGSATSAAVSPPASASSSHYLAHRLENVQNYLREWVSSTSGSPQEQASLVSIIVSWARHLASDPLWQKEPTVNPPLLPRSHQKNTIDAHGDNNSKNHNNDNVSSSGIVVDYNHQHACISSTTSGVSGGTSAGGDMIMMMGVGGNCFLSPSTSLETPAGSKEEAVEDDDDDASSVIRMSSSPPTAV